MKKFAVTFEVQGLVTIYVDAEDADDADMTATDLMPELPWHETSFTDAEIIHIEEVKQV